jgi:4-amino-4-deoxy-L-arabinose transferase-like glycosyltransferase
LRALHLDPGRHGVSRLLAPRRRRSVGAAARGYAPFAALACLAALVRLPFLGSIGPDEGGYAYVAWQWSRGVDLYRSVWVDRPQGLILVYRLLVSISHSAWAIRLGAVLAGIAIVLLLAAIGRLLDAPATGFMAATLYAIAGIGPHIEGYTFNGELAAAVPATAAVAAAVGAWRRDSRAWLIAAAACGGSALLMKQSGFDGLAVVFAVALLRRERLKSVALVAAAAAIPLGVSAIAGWLSGWSFYWAAVVGNHLPAATAASRRSHLAESLPAAARDLLPLAAVALGGFWFSRKRPLQFRLGLVWLAAALVAVNIGGLYWPHYYVQLLPPLCLLAALGLARLRDRRVAWATVAVVVLPALAFVAGVVRASDRQQDLLVKYALGFENDQRVARYVQSHSSSNEPVYALASRADFYFLASRSAAFPYLWGQPLNTIPGAVGSLERTLASPRRPKLVVLFQRRPLHRHRRLQEILDRYYREIWRAPRTGTPVLAPVTGAGPPLGDESAPRG